MLGVEDLRRHPGLLDQLERAHRLGFLGPGPVEPHIDHTSAFLLALEDTQGTVVDLGSGGGVPGLVLGVARPDLRLILVESRARRCRFLEEALAALALDASVVEGRAEVAARSALRGGVDAVVARSFGPPAATAECGSPLLRPGGRLIVSEPPPPPQPDRWPAAGVALLGLAVGPRLVREAAVQVLEQVSACPEQYPRRVGLPGQRPLF